MLVARVTGFGKANPAESGLPRVGGLPAPGPGPGPAGPSSSAHGDTDPIQGRPAEFGGPVQHNIYTYTYIKNEFTRK